MNTCGAHLFQVKVPKLEVFEAGSPEKSYIVDLGSLIKNVQVLNLSESEEVLYHESIYKGRHFFHMQIVG
jgi:hypothetical protein